MCGSIWIISKLVYALHLTNKPIIYVQAPSTLLTVQDGETSLNMAHRDMASYAYKFATIGYQRDNSNRTAQEVQADLVVVQAEITTLNATIAALPEGLIKKARLPNECVKKCNCAHYQEEDELHRL